VNNGEPTATMTAVRVASIDILRAKTGESPAAMTALLIASTEIVRVKYGATIKFEGESTKMETCFAVIIIIIIIITITIINLKNCLKIYVRKLLGGKSIMGKFRHQWDDVKMCLKIRVVIGLNWHTL
jgi:hypothetical protein